MDYIIYQSLEYFGEVDLLCCYNRALNQTPKKANTGSQEI